MKCKPGDLAWIVGGQNVGWLVKVIERTKPGGRSPRGRPYSIDADDWFCESVSGEFRHGDYFICADDARLDPIRPPKITETTDALEGVL